MQLNINDSNREFKFQFKDSIQRELTVRSDPPVIYCK